MDNEERNAPTEEKITRKEALVKAGKYAAITAASMMFVLGPSNKAAAQSTSPSSSPRAPRDW